MIYKKSEAIATARVREKENHIFKIERVAVLVEHRNMKVGSLLINEIIKYHNETEKKSSIILHSQVAVEKFYKSLNFVSLWRKLFRRWYFAYSNEAYQLIINVTLL